MRPLCFECDPETMKATERSSKCSRIPLRYASRLVGECVSILSSWTPTVSSSIDPSPSKHSAETCPASTRSGRPMLICMSLAAPDHGRGKRGASL